MRIHLPILGVRSADHHFDEDLVLVRLGDRYILYPHLGS